MKMDKKHSDKPLIHICPSTLLGAPPTDALHTRHGLLPYWQILDASLCCITVCFRSSFWCCSL